MSNLPIHNNPQFAAYTRLTVVQHVKGLKNGHFNSGTAGMDFNYFVDALKKNEVINQEFARELDQEQKRHSEINSRINGNNNSENQTLSYIEKAYNLGLVDPSGFLFKSEA